VGHALAVIAGDELGQRRGRAQPRRRQLDVVEGDGLLGVAAEPEPLADLRRGGVQVGERGLLVLIPPPPVLAEAGLGYQ
jgi:Mg-chelatase subunit ChlD